MTEFEKMLSGQIYDSSDEYLVNLRNKANLLCTKYNQLSNYDNSLKAELLKQLIPNQKDNCYFQGPIHIDYGINMELGSNVYANYNFTCLDICKVTIKDNVMFGPNVTLAGALHPLNSEKRFIKENNKIHCMEYGGEIIIEGNCWICSNVVICPGVKIGKNTTIGANSVVTKDMPENSLCAGNPCKFIKKNILKS